MGGSGEQPATLQAPWARCGRQPEPYPLRRTVAASLWRCTSHQQSPGLPLWSASASHWPAARTTGLPAVKGLSFHSSHHSEGGRRLLGRKAVPARSKSRHRHGAHFLLFSVWPGSQRALELHSCNEGVGRQAQNTSIASVISIGYRPILPHRPSSRSGRCGIKPHRKGPWADCPSPLPLTQPQPSLHAVTGSDSRPRRSGPYSNQPVGGKLAHAPFHEPAAGARSATRRWPLRRRDLSAGSGRAMEPGPRTCWRPKARASLAWALPPLPCHLSDAMQAAVLQR